jgi:predicted DNA-binding transcriptional regulator YafY
MPRGDQLARQWRLLESLGRPQGLPIEAAARHLGCTVRTVCRDLHALQDAGFPIYDERDGRRGVWKVESGFRDRLPVPLSLSEIVALLVSHDLLDHGGAGPFGPSVASALAKLRALLTPRALELLDRMRLSIGARTVGAKLPIAGRDHLAEIERALAERRTLEIRYFSLARNAETERRVDPYHLRYVSGGLYLVGYCHVRREARVFATERVRSATMLAETFAMPPDFDVTEYLRGAWGIVRGDLVRVRAVFSPAAAPDVRGRLWHASQELRELSGGRLELRLQVADTLEVCRWLLGFGAEVEVVAPVALRETIRREAERMATAPGPGRKPLARAGRSGGGALVGGLPPALANALDERVAGAGAVSNHLRGARAARAPRVSRLHATWRLRSCVSPSLLPRARRRAVPGA